MIFSPRPPTPISKLQAIQPLRNRQLRPRQVGQVDDHQDVLQVAVECFFKVGAVHFGYRRDGIHEESADGVVGLFGSGLQIASEGECLAKSGL